MTLLDFPKFLMNKKIVERYFMSGATIHLNPNIKRMQKVNKAKLIPNEAEKLPLDLSTLQEYITKLDKKNSLNIEDIIQTVNNGKNIIRYYKDNFDDDKEVENALEWFVAYIINLDVFSLMSFTNICNKIKVKSYYDRESDELITFQDVIYNLIKENKLDATILLNLKSLALCLTEEKPKISRIHWIEDEYIRHFILQNITLYKSIFLAIFCMEENTIGSTAGA